MTIKRRGLGRGLDALLGADQPELTAEGELRELPLEQIQRGRYQPRDHIEPQALAELADSIRAQGVVQPIIVRPIAKDRFEIIAGERRWRAAQIAELRKIPCVVRDVEDRQALAMALIENIQREDLSPLEEARSLDRLRQEFELTHHDVAEAVGRSRASVSNLLRLLELNKEVREFLEGGKLEMGHARALLGLGGSEQTEAAAQVVQRQLNVRQTEALVRDWSKRPAALPVAPRPDPNISRLEQDLAERLGAKVVVQDRGGKGKLVIQYHSLEELDGILARIR